MRAMSLSHPPTNQPLRIGCGAGFSGDRWDASVPVVASLMASGGPAVLMFETLAERTLALAQLQRHSDPSAGCEPMLERFVAPVLRDCMEHGIPIIGNFGAAHPRAAARRLHALAAALGLPPIRIAVVEGDDLLGTLDRKALHSLLPASLDGRELISANAYLGAVEIAQALRSGAQLVVTGRVADPSLALGPMLAHFGWALDDWDRLASGTIAGHLLECGAQVCGGYFADPGIKDVPNLSSVGFPIVEMHADGDFIVTKPEGTGGCVDARTVKEQLLYEIHDPAAYMTPDVVADITELELSEAGKDRVHVCGVRGHAQPATLKATVCFDAGWLAEGEISYAGENAVGRGRLASEIVRDRLRQIGLVRLPLRLDLIGQSSVLAEDGASQRPQACLADAPCQDIRLRVAANTDSRDEAESVVREVLALYTCGPAGGGGVRSQVSHRLASDSCYVPRDWIQPSWSFVS
ncbi:acyclic terpene utilization AtuA family protein [Hydrogenophaga sp.]|uniref:acyclic terpene utilization AtuA family protein n=2 Tax=Hydrogenophaga sp. TaxID=1904254 RepID=UPI0027311EDD|nr:acyclic terpene utilization AtuA family protein [Hydrogenophaga sp.]